MAGNTDMQQVSIENQEAHQQWLKTNALAALAKTYGAQYGDPSSVDVASQAQTRQAQLPYAGQAAAADVAKTQAETGAATQGTRNKNLFAMGEQLQAFADPRTGAIDPNKTMAVGAALGLNPQQTQQYAQLFSQPNQQPGNPNAPTRNQALDGMIHGAAGAAFMAIQGTPQYGTDAEGNPVITYRNKMGDQTTTGAPVGPDGRPITPLANVRATQGNERIEQGNERIGLSAQRLGLMTARYGLQKTRMAQQAVNEGIITGDQADEYIASLGNSGGGNPPLPPGTPQPTTNVVGGPGRSTAPAPAQASQTAPTPGQVLANATNTKLDFKSRQAFATSLGQSGPSSAGGIIRSGGAVIAHLGLLKQYSEALSNGDIKGANSIAQEFRTQTGQVPPTQFDAQREVVASELSRFLTARGGTQSQIERMEKSISSANSPQQLRSVIDTWSSDIAGQFRALGQQAHSFGMDSQFDAQLTPEARALVHGGGGQAPGGPLKVGDTLPGTNLTIVKIH